MNLMPRLRLGVAVVVFIAPGLAPAGQSSRSAEALVFNCFTCHGTDGRSPAEVHSINGKSSDYLKKKLNAFKAGQGNPTIMDRIAKAYTDDEISLISEYIANLE